MQLCETHYWRELRMELVRSTYSDRVSDIEAYFKLVENISAAISNGGAKFKDNTNVYTVTIQQQKILFANTYIQLYNLIESTVTQLLGAVGRHTKSGIDGDLTKLSDKIRTLYLKHIIPPEDNVSPEKKLERSLELLQQALGLKELDITIPRGGGGNWDVKEIDKLNKRIGVDLQLPQSINTQINIPFRNGSGPLRYVKVVRNELGHGSISFAECGSEHTVSDFRSLIDIVKQYLEHLMDAYEQFINDKGYLAEGMI